MTPQDELQNYLNFWQQKGQSAADLVSLLRAEADKIAGVEPLENQRDIISALAADNASHVETISTLTSQLNDAIAHIEDLKKQVAALPVDPATATPVDAGNDADASIATQPTSSPIEDGSSPVTTETSPTSTDDAGNVSGEPEQSAVSSENTEDTKTNTPSSEPEQTAA
jgi:hypothetical protein